MKTHPEKTSFGLKAIGEMSIGISHDVNNILQVLLAQITLLEKDVNGKNALERLARMKQAIANAGKAIQELLKFARDGKYMLQVFETSGAIRQGRETIIWILNGKKVRLECELADGLFIKCDKNLFQQALFNIIKNAAEAIDISGKGSRITVKTRELDGNALVEVSDDGPGIAQSELEKLFLPFFTTKGEGNGCGLGLSFSRCIIEGMGGHLLFLSGKNGTVFTIIFPQNTDPGAYGKDERAECGLGDAKQTDKA